ncbi:MAG TPA: hypothetical protein VMM79_17870 [Longimicrobiales bacterium]|nr:hypothetical protein [Longimicrobiales bacterium]
MIGVVALVASLVFVGLQLRQARDIAVSTNDSAYVQTRIEVYNSINQYASIWISGSKGETLAEPDATIFRNLVRMLNESTFVDYIQQTRMGEPTAVVIMHDFAAFLHQNPGAQRHWLEIEDNQIAYRNRLAPDGNDVSFWRDAILADLARLDQSSAQPLPDDGVVQARVTR